MDILSEQEVCWISTAGMFRQNTYNLPTVRNILWYIPFKRLEGNAPDAS